MFNSTCEKKAPSECKGGAERQVQRSLEEEGNIIDMVQGRPRTSTPGVSARLNVSHKKSLKKATTNRRTVSVPYPAHSVS